MQFSYLFTQIDTVMKKFILLYMLLMTLSAMAQNYIPGAPWPQAGYDLSSYSRHLSVSVQRFADNDTLYYLRMKPDAIKKYDGFYFVTIDRIAADSILRYTLTSEKFTKLRHRDKWFHLLMDGLGAEVVYRSLNGYQKDINKTEWTYYSPQQNQPFNTETAAKAYSNQRAPKKKNEISLEAWDYFYSNVKFVLKIMGGGADTRTLYDKVMQSGGY